MEKKRSEVSRFRCLFFKFSCFHLFWLLLFRLKVQVMHIFFGGDSQREKGICNEEQNSIITQTNIFHILCALFLCTGICVYVSACTTYVCGKYIFYVNIYTYVYILYRNRVTSIKFIGKPMWERSKHFQKARTYIVIY